MLYIKNKTMAKAKKQKEVLEQPQTTIEVQNWYEFDWDNKINSLEDLKEIFKSLRMTVSDRAEDFDVLKKYIKEEIAYQTTNA